MIKLTGDKETVNWYKYVFKHGNTDKEVRLNGFIPDNDGLPFVLCHNDSFKTIQKGCRYNTPRLRACLFRLLFVGAIFPNHYGNFDTVTDDITSLDARVQGYIFRHNIKVFGKKRFIKAYME